MTEKVWSCGSMPGGTALLPAMVWAGYFTKHGQNVLVFYFNTHQLRALQVICLLGAGFPHNIFKELPQLRIKGVEKRANYPQPISQLQLLAGGQCAQEYTSCSAINTNTKLMWRNNIGKSTNCLNSYINHNCGINTLSMKLSPQFLDDSFLFDGLSHSSGIEHLWTLGY